VAQGGATVYGAGAAHTDIVGDVFVQNMDAEAVAAGLGLASDVAQQALDVVYGSSQEAMFLAGDVTANALDANTEVSTTAIMENSNVATAAITETGAIADTAVYEANQTARAGMDFAENVTANALDANTTTTENAFLFGAEIAAGAGDIALAGIDAANRAVDTVAASTNEALLLVDRTQGNMANAFETFGTRLSEVKAIEVSQGQTERNKPIFATIAAVVILGVTALVTLFFRRKK
jgi:hypothetical protein